MGCLFDMIHMVVVRRYGVDNEGYGNEFVWKLQRIVFLNWIAQ